MGKEENTEEVENVWQKRYGRQSYIEKKKQKQKDWDEYQNKAKEEEQANESKEEKEVEKKKISLKSRNITWRIKRRKKGKKNGKAVRIKKKQVETKRQGKDETNKNNEGRRK